METKQCSKCQEIKSYHEFYKQKRNKDGLTTICKVCINLIRKEYYKNNKDKVKEYKAREYQQNKERKLEQKHKYYQNNRQYILEKRKEYREKNEQKIKQYKKQHRQNNTELYKDIDKNNYQKRIQWYMDYKKTLKCEICGEDHYQTITFHHKNPKEKEYNIANIRSLGDKEKILLEISKCQIICDNCHRNIHSDLNRKSCKREKFIRDYKSSHPCKCGENRSACLQFHHLDPKTKIKDIGYMQTHSKLFTLEQIKEEIDKCMVICGNCHKIEHSDK